MKKLFPLMSFVAAFSTSFAAWAGVIAGPTLDQTESGWSIFGLEILANTNTSLISVRYPNQGNGGSIELRDAAGNLLATKSVAAGDTNPTISFGVPLVAGQTYRLYSTVSNTSRWANFTTYPVNGGDITVVGGWGNTSTPASPQPMYWFSFNDITTGSTSVCGNGVVDPGELCDDGDTFNDDECVEGCVPAACGDGFLRFGVEECDDGNSASDDACTILCTSAVCGDGFIFGKATQGGTESCDDANQKPGDGCGADCKSEMGFVCMGQPSVCASTCGDGVKASNEGCDDGNLLSGDGCSATCQSESTGVGGAGGSGGPSSSSSSTVGNGGGWSGDGGDDSGGGETRIDRGCGCAVPGSSSERSVLIVLAGLALFGLRRRRAA